MKRKALATMMAAAMVLSMVGCGGAKTDSTASTTTTENISGKRGFPLWRT